MPFDIWGQWSLIDYNSPGMGFIVKGNSYRFHHWKDKSDWELVGEIDFTKHKHKTFYIQFIK